MKGYSTFVHLYKSKKFPNISFKESKKVRDGAIPNLGISADHTRFKVSNHGRLTVSLILQRETVKLKLIIGNDHDDL